MFGPDDELVLFSALFVVTTQLGAKAGRLLPRSDEFAVGSRDPGEVVRLAEGSGRDPVGPHQHRGAQDDDKTDVGQNDVEWARVLDVNVTGDRSHHPRRSSHPAMVNMCSAVAVVGVRQRALCSASKDAVLR